MEYTTRLLSIAVLLLAMTVTAYAHGTSVKVDKPTAAPGDTITVKGEGLTSNGEIKLSLRGMQDYSLGTARGNEHGVFEQQVTLPADIHPGDYSLMAEGEKTASVKLKVIAGQASHMGPMKLPPASREHEQGMTGMTEMASEAKAGAMEVQRPSGTREAILRWGIVVVALVLGVALRGRAKRRIQPVAGNE
jgi:hypothetical protein